MRTVRDVEIGGWEGTTQAGNISHAEDQESEEISNFLNLQEPSHTSDNSSSTDETPSQGRMNPKNQEKRSGNTDVQQDEDETVGSKSAGCQNSQMHNMQEESIPDGQQSNVNALQILTAFGNAQEAQPFDRDDGNVDTPRKELLPLTPQNINTKKNSSMHQLGFESKMLDSDIKNSVFESNHNQPEARNKDETNIILDKEKIMNRNIEMKAKSEAFTREKNNNENAFRVSCTDLSLINGERRCSEQDSRLVVDRILKLGITTPSLETIFEDEEWSNTSDDSQGGCNNSTKCLSRPKKRVSSLETIYEDVPLMICEETSQGECESSNASSQSLKILGKQIDPLQTIFEDEELTFELGVTKKMIEEYVSCVRENNDQNTGNWGGMSSWSGVLSLPDAEEDFQGTLRCFALPVSSNDTVCNTSNGEHAGQKIWTLGTLAPSFDPTTKENSSSLSQESFKEEMVAGVCFNINTNSFEDNVQSLKLKYHKNWMRRWNSLTPNSEEEENDDVTSSSSIDDQQKESTLPKVNHSNERLSKLGIHSAPLQTIFEDEEFTLVESGEIQKNTTNSKQKYESRIDFFQNDKSSRPLETIFEDEELTLFESEEKLNGSATLKNECDCRALQDMTQYFQPLETIFEDEELSLSWQTSEKDIQNEANDWNDVQEPKDSHNKVSRVRHNESSSADPFIKARGIVIRNLENAMPLSEVFENKKEQIIAACSCTCDDKNDMPLFIASTSNNIPNLNPLCPFEMKEQHQQFDDSLNIGISNISKGSVSYNQQRVTGRNTNSRTSDSGSCKIIGNNELWPRQYPKKENCVLLRTPMHSAAVNGANVNGVQDTVNSNSDEKLGLTEKKEKCEPGCAGKCISDVSLIKTKLRDPSMITDGHVHTDLFRKGWNRTGDPPRTSDRLGQHREQEEKTIASVAQLDSENIEGRGLLTVCRCGHVALNSSVEKKDELFRSNGDVLGSSEQEFPRGSHRRSPCATPELVDSPATSDSALDSLDRNEAVQLLKELRDKLLPFASDSNGEKSDGFCKVCNTKSTIEPTKSAYATPKNSCGTTTFFGKTPKSVDAITKSVSGKFTLKGTNFLKTNSTTSKSSGAAIGSNGTISKYFTANASYPISKYAMATLKSAGSVSAFPVKFTGTYLQSTGSSAKSFNANTKNAEVTSQSFSTVSKTAKVIARAECTIPDSTNVSTNLNYTISESSEVFFQCTEINACSTGIGSKFTGGTSETTGTASKPISYAVTLVPPTSYHGNPKLTAIFSEASESMTDSMDIISESPATLPDSTGAIPEVPCGITKIYKMDEEPQVTDDDDQLASPRGRSFSSCLRAAVHCVTPCAPSSWQDPPTDWAQSTSPTTQILAEDNQTVAQGPEMIRPDGPRGSRDAFRSGYCCLL